MRGIVIATMGIIAAAAIIGVAVPVYSCRPIPARYDKAIQETRQVAIALEMYATDHQGTLPTTVDALVPHYLPDKKLMKRLWLTTPEATLQELPAETIVAFKLIPDSSRAVIVRPDFSVHMVLQ